MPISGDTSLPPIPIRLSRIDATNAGEHFRLAQGDLCLYVWEYTRHGGFGASAANSLISNLKKKPSRVARHPPEARHKECAIRHAARALRTLVGRPWVERHGTWVPVPCSKAAGHPDHDRRLLRVLELAFRDCAADIRPLLAQVDSTAADHEVQARQKLPELLAVSRIDESVAQPTRPYIVVFDDVLNSGKHFKVAQRLLAQRFPQATVLGLFLARCLPGEAGPGAAPTFYPRRE